MQRLRALRDHLIENANLQHRDISCHVAGSDQDGLETETETGVALFEDTYNAVIYIEDVSELEYDYIRLLLHEWFRENNADEERFSVSGDFISDVLSLVTIDLTLKETVHLVEDPEGKIDREGNFYSMGEAPVPEGI